MIFCSYSALAHDIGDRSVFGVDDGGILHSINLKYDSIDTIVRTASPIIQEYLRGKGIQRLVLGGWSYGGVIALKMAQYWHEERISNIIVEAVVLIDSPISTPKKLREDDVPMRNESVAAIHFAYCTNILKEYYMTPRPLVPCKLIDIRAQDSSYDFESESELQKYTTNHAVRYVSPGTHWTVIAEENASNVAKALQLCLD